MIFESNLQMRISLAPNSRRAGKKVQSRAVRKGGKKSRTPDGVRLRLLMLGNQAQAIAVVAA
jgi:hypothetical protein